MAIRDKTQLKAQSLQKVFYKNNAHKNKFNPNYYPSVASVDSSSIESTYIFPKTLKQNASCVTENKNSKSTNMQTNSPPKLDTSKTMLTPPKQNILVFSTHMYFPHIFPHFI